MNKLQLYINVSYNGFKKMTDINADGRIAAYVCDISEALENIKFITREKHTFYLLKYVEEGTFIIVIRTIPDTESDHLAAWVFVPAGIVTKPNDLSGIVESVSAMISNSKITSEHVSRIQALFNRSFNVDPQEGRMAENYGVLYAHRFYGGDTGLALTQLIDNYRYQTAYLPYAGVLLVDKDAVESVDGCELKGRPRTMVRLLPPDPADGPYIPSIFNKPFDEPYLVPRGGVTEIVWTALGLDDVIQKIDVHQPDMKPGNINASTPEAIPYPVDVPDSDEAESNESDHAESYGVDTTESGETNVAAHSHSDITDSQSTVSEAEISNAERQHGAQSDITRLKGEKPRRPEETIPFKENKQTQTTRPTLTNTEQKTYNFEIPASDSYAKPIKFHINTRGTIDSSPLMGYDHTSDIEAGEDKVNTLEFNGEGTMRSRITWAAIGFAAGVLLTILLSWTFSCGGDSKPATATPVVSAPDSVSVPVSTDNTPASTSETTPATTQPGEATTPAPASSAAASSSAEDIAAAVKYLDSKEIWEKGEMEGYPALRGLFDDMNQYRLDAIVNTWGPKLTKSKNFAKLAGYTQNSIRGKKLQKYGIKAPYNTPGDTKISIKGYWNTIDK